MPSTALRMRTLGAFARYGANVSLNPSTYRMRFSLH